VEAIYTCAATFAGAGIGYTAYQRVRNIHKAGCLKEVITGYTQRQPHVPSSKILTFPWMRIVAWLTRDANVIRDLIFDRAASWFVQPCDVFHGWSDQCLFSLRRARALGAVTFVERPNSHPRSQQQLLEEEFSRWGYVAHKPVDPVGMKRALAEFEEADFITVPSKFAYDSMIAEGVPKEKLFLIPYGVDTQRFRPGSPPVGTFRLLFVGQVSLRKGVPYLLEAWQRLHLPHAELWLVGRVMPNIRHAISSFLTDQTIRFLGHRKDPSPLYQVASAFVLSSIEEGSALVTYEAMASGLPLIFTPNCGAVSRDGIEGIQVPIRDVDALAAAIERLYEDPGLAREMGQAGRRRAEDFTWEAVGPLLLSAYRKALRTRGKPT